MKKHLLVYRGAVQPENGQQHMKDWMAWVHGMGDAMIDPGTPVFPSVTVTSARIHATDSSNPICGISLIQAANQEVATALAQSSPHLDIGGTIEVAETMNLPMT